MSDSYLSRDLSSMVGLSRIWLSLGLVVSLTAALLMGLPSPAGAVAGYGDVDEGTWYTDAVQWSTDNGIADIAGFCFAPDTPVSRGETAVWIYNMENQPDAGTSHSFSDVTDASQDDAVSWMANNEITTGKSPTTFAPDDTLTRAEAATFLHRLAGKPSAPPHSFVDVVTGWQQGGVSWMSHTGITTGTSPTTFAPEVTLTRAHLVTFLYRYQGEPDVTINTATPVCDPADDAVTVTQYQPGDTIAGFPSGFAAVSGNFSGASVVITGGGSTVTVEITSNGSAAYSDTTYTCASVGGCTIVNGRVTKGTINASTGTVGAEPTPDLVVETPTVDTSAPVVGDRFTLSATVRNLGDGRSASTTLRYYQSTDATITTRDTEVGTDSVSGLDAQETGDESIRVTARSTPGTYYFAAPGTYYYGACVDSVSDESNTTNNCSTAVTVTVGAAPTPDLVVGLAVSAGQNHWCVVRVDGSVTCWGSNNFGQSDAPEGVFQSVSAGWGHSCGLRVDGSVTCWGRDGSRPDAPEGVFQSVSAGGNHSCGVRVDGSVTCWGSNNRYGQSNAPEGVFQSVSAGERHSCGVRVDGSVTCWGSNDFGESDAPEGVFQSVSAGWGHSCGVRVDGSVTCWGSNDFGQSDAPEGVFQSVSASSFLHSCGVRVDGSVTCWGSNGHGKSDAPEGVFQSVSAGSFLSCGVRVDGSVTCWGHGDFGQSDAPAGVFQSVSAGWGHSCGLRDDGSVTCWGSNNFGKSDAPEGVFQSVSAGSFLHSCGVRVEGSVTCWGDNVYGQSDAPEGVFQSVSAGQDHSCGVRVDGSVTCWGGNGDGQSDAPEGVFQSVSAGQHHSCGVRVDGSVTCWGHDGHGESDAPEGVFQSVSSGERHSCGLRDDGSVTCWGGNGESDAPEGVFQSVSAGWGHSCGLRDDSSVTCWGSNNSGQSDAPGGVFQSVSAGRGHSCGVRDDGTVTCWGSRLGVWKSGDDDAPAEAPAAPMVEPRAGTSTELEVQFEDFFGVGETRAYDFAIRAISGGSWVEACNTFSNTSGWASTATITQGFTGLEPGTTHDVRYRYRNSSRCGAGAPGEWSPIAQGTTGDDEPGPSSSVFGAGDTIPGFPSGFDASSGDIRNASVQVSDFGRMVTVTMRNGGTAEYSHATYTCTSPGGCTIVNGRVTNGTVNATSSTVGAAFTPELA